MKLQFSLTKLCHTVFTWICHIRTTALRKGLFPFKTCSPSSNSFLLPIICLRAWRWCFAQSQTSLSLKPSLSVKSIHSFIFFSCLTVSPGLKIVFTCTEAHMNNPVPFHTRGVEGCSVPHHRQRRLTAEPAPRAAQLPRRQQAARRLL